MSESTTTTGSEAELPEPDPRVDMAEPVQRTYLRQRISQMLFGVFLVDAGVVAVSATLAWWWRASLDEFWGRAPHPYEWNLLGLGMILLWLAMLLALGAYRVRNYGTGFEEFRAIFVASVMALAIAAFGGFMAPHQPTRGFPILMFLIATPLLLAARYVDRKTLHRRRERGRLANRVIAVGAPTAIAELVEVLSRAPWMGYHVVGMCVPRAEDPVGIGIPVLGDVNDVRQAAIDAAADTVLVAGGSYSSAADLRRLGWAIEGLHLDMLVVPALTDIAGPRVHLRNVAGLPLVHVEEPQIDQAGGRTKRVFDVVVALLLLAVSSPLTLLAALIIFLQDRGPVLYRQSRVGLRGADFPMIKFRSMIVNAEAVREELADENEHDGVLFKIRDDPRVTPFGRFMRKFSIDELPQLLNVVKGEMSLVGPRPPLATEVEQYDDDVHRRLLVRPGMTGLWQVSGRSDLAWSESVRLDLYYVDNWSMITDLVIIAKTVKAVLASHGAY